MSANKMPYYKAQYVDNCSDLFGWQKDKVEEQPCFVQNFFEHQKELPPHLRTGICMISCTCRKCSPGRL